MNTKYHKYIAQVPLEFQSEGIKWLIIEPQVDKGRIVGYYLFGHEDLNTPCSWDSWYQTLEDVFEAGKGYGIEISDWKEQS